MQILTTVSSLAQSEAFVNNVCVFVSTCQSYLYSLKATSERIYNIYHFLSAMMEMITTRRRIRVRIRVTFPPSTPIPMNRTTSIHNSPVVNMSSWTTSISSRINVSARNEDVHVPYDVPWPRSTSMVNVMMVVVVDLSLLRPRRREKRPTGS